MRRSAGDDRSESQRRPRGVSQLDPSALIHKRLARHGPVDEHAVTALAAHRPPGWGRSHLEVGAGYEGVDDLTSLSGERPTVKGVVKVWGSSDAWAERERTMSAGVGKARSFQRGGSGAPATILVFRRHR